MIQTQTIDIEHVRKVLQNCPHFDKIVNYEYPYGDVLSKKLIAITTAKDKDNKMVECISLDSFYELINEDNGVAIYTAPAIVNDKTTNIRFMVVGEEVTVLGTWDGINELGMAAKGIKKIEKGSTITPLYMSVDTVTSDVCMVEGNETVVTDEIVTLSYHQNLFSLPANAVAITDSHLAVHIQHYFCPMYKFSLSNAIAKSELYTALIILIFSIKGRI